MITVGPGTRVGEMVIIGNAPNRELPRGQAQSCWLMRCDCGRVQHRAKCHVTRAIKYSQNMSCYECRDDYRRGLGSQRRLANREALISLFLDSGSLWSPDASRRLASEVATALGSSLENDWLSLDSQYMGDINNTNANYICGSPSVRYENGLNFVSRPGLRNLCGDCSSVTEGCHVCVCCGTPICYSCTADHHCGKPAPKSVDAVVAGVEASESKCRSVRVNTKLRGGAVEFHKA